MCIKFIKLCISAITLHMYTYMYTYLYVTTQTHLCVSHCTSILKKMEKNKVIERKKNRKRDRETKIERNRLKQKQKKID